MMKIDKKILAAKVAPKPESGTPPIQEVHTQTNLNPERNHPGEWVFDSRTYKVKSRFSKHNIYCTIVDDNQGMFSLFFNCKDADLAERLQGISVLASAVLRRTSDPMFIAEELQSIEGNRGYLRAPRPGEDKGKYIGSLEAEVGALIEYHLKHGKEKHPVLAETGVNTFIPGVTKLPTLEPVVSKSPLAQDDVQQLFKRIKELSVGEINPDFKGSTVDPKLVEENLSKLAENLLLGSATNPAKVEASEAHYDQCPECRAFSYKKEAGCGNCDNCGYSKCS